MAVKYKLYQEKRDTEFKDKWYARAIHDDTVDLKALAHEIQENVSVKESDVYGVLIEMVNVMKRELQASHNVRIDRLGTFRIGLRTSPAASAKAFTPLKNIKGYRINFLPEYTVGKTGEGKNVHQVAMLDGISVREATFNDVKKDDESDGNGEETNP